MSTIPKNPNIKLEFAPDNHTLVKTELDGDGTMDTTRIEKIFSNLLHVSEHLIRSRLTTPKTNGSSSWDSDSEPEVAEQIFTNDEPWFNLADGYVVHEEDMDEALNRVEA